MVKAPSSHGLERKFKPWRRGKSEKAKSNKSSLKQQVRSLERLLKKEGLDQEMRVSLGRKIAGLKGEITDKANVQQERTNATNSHGTRFLERQRLVRLEKTTRKNPNLAKAAADDELFKIALDMAYVAHYPHDIQKYQPLFRQGTRSIDSGRYLNQRASTRQRVLTKLASAEADQERAGWISKDLYDMLPKDWSVELEKKAFGEGQAVSGSTTAAVSDNRFAVAAQSSALLEAAEQAEVALDKEEEKEAPTKTLRKKSVDNSVEDSTSSDSSKETDALEKKPEKRPAVAAKAKKQEDSSSSSESDSSDSDDESDTKQVVPAKKQGNTSDSSDSSDSDSSDSDSSSSSDDDDNTKKDTPKRKADEEAVVEPAASDNIEDDDFLVAADDTNAVDVFSNATSHLPAIDENKGDKSKGWATQRQRPGQFKKKRVRR